MIRDRLIAIIDGEAQGMDGPLLSEWMCEKIANRVIEEMGLLALEQIAATQPQSNGD